MTKDPWFLFFPSDWLGSSRIALMDAHEERGLLRILCHLWANDNCALPDDDEVLSRLSLMFERWFSGGSKVLRNCLEPHPELAGFVTNAKLLRLKRERHAWRKKSQEGGLKSAAVRRRTRGGSKGASTTVATKLQPRPQANGNIPTPTPTPTPVPTTKAPAKPPRATYDEAFERWWQKYPRKVGKLDAHKAWLAAMKRIAAARGLLGEEAAGVLQECVDAFARTPAGQAGQFCPYPATWLNSGRYDDDQKTWNKDPQPNGSRLGPGQIFDPAIPTNEIGRW